MKKFAYLLPAMGLIALSLPAMADSTLTVAGFGSGSDSSIGPYTFRLNNGPANLQLFCLDDFLTISQGEYWNVNIVSGDQITSNKQQYAEAAYIYSELNQTDPLSSSSPHHPASTFSNTEVQDALWDIFNPGSADEDSDTKDLLKLAAQNYGSVDLNLYDFYIPDGPVHNTQRGDTSTPQTFIGLNPDPTPSTPTPEPSSLMLFGSGLLGLAGAARRKFGKA